MTSSSPIPQELLDFEDNYLEPEDAELARRLGLRPTHYSPHSTAHPDTRPCPSWCWLNATDGADHEVTAVGLMEAVHSLEPSPKIALSLYDGDPGTGSDRVVSTATLEPRLEQVGGNAPTIQVGLRQYRGRTMEYADEALRLSLNDARELVTVLTYLLDTATAATAAADAREGSSP